MRESGSIDARSEVAEMIHVVKSRKEQLLRDGREVRFSRKLEQTVVLIARRREPLRLSESAEGEPTAPIVKLTKKFFRWFGAICPGTLLGIGDGAALLGFWGPVQPILALGAVGSMATAIGQILTALKESEDKSRQTRLNR